MFRSAVTAYPAAPIAIAVQPFNAEISCATYGGTIRSSPSPSRLAFAFGDVVQALTRPSGSIT
jgi:hypothetical protein